MKITLVAALVLGIAISAPASARNYDCSKAGNASKTACKTATKEATKAIAKSAPKAMPAPKAAATKVSSTTTTKTTTERTFDCTKAGNKNKAVCKTAAVTPSKPVVKETTTAVATRNYDCSKAGNATKQVCKTSAVAHQTTVAKPVAAPRSAPSRPSMAPAPTASMATGATATCKDGTSSHSKVHAGACSHHGGVAKWL
jgi:hypothetical protein